MKPTLYVVATPIGNLEDITLRAIRVLKEVDFILCEDTRVTKNLLKHYNIATKTQSYHAQSNDSKSNKILALLEEGKSLALVSDAGTPLISDPGVQLVQEVRRKFGDSVAIVAVPGPSALTAALSIAGISGNEFTFWGFVPHKKGRETLFKKVAASELPSVMYESPHRIVKTLESFVTALDEKHIVSIGRELTKVYEEFVQGSPTEVLEYFTKNKDKVRGEFVVIVSRA